MHPTGRQDQAGLVREEPGDPARSDLALRRSEERYRTLFNCMTEGFALHEVICDESGRPVDYRFLDLNPAFERLTGLRRENVLLKTRREILPDDDPRWTEAFGQVALTGQPAEFEYHSASLGRHYHVFAYSHAPRQFAAVFLDITDRKLADEILRQDKEALERIVRERTENLIGVRLELEQAKRLSDIGTLSATVAHELRNPLAAIAMCAAIIRRKTKDALILKQVRHVDQMIEESNQIINNLLFYSRLKPPRPEPCDLYAILADCVAGQERHPTKKIVYATDFDQPHCPVTVDAVQMKEVCNNLLNNAADAAPADGGRIEVRARCRGATVEVAVVDNGPGLDPESLAKAFDPFFTTKAKGTGLGLTVCSQIVRMHRGRIEVANGPEAGAVVTIILPSGEAK